MRKAGSRFATQFSAQLNANIKPHVAATVSTNCAGPSKIQPPGKPAALNSKGAVTAPKKMARAETKRFCEYIFME